MACREAGDLAAGSPLEVVVSLQCPESVPLHADHHYPRPALVA